MIGAQSAPGRRVTVTKSLTPNTEATPSTAKTAAAKGMSAAASLLAALNIASSLVSSVNFIASGFGVGDGVAEAILRSYATAAAGSSDLRLNDVVHAGAVSPRGVAVQENNPDKLLALANASLHAPGAARDVEEGAYWLKRYIAASLGEERMLRALTQLGSAYAEPASGKPDFARARQLWEFASAFGDPVAMCFLGALHEHGLGVAAEKKAALHWYARAKSAGGCPQLEESIARVMP